MSMTWIIVVVGFVGFICGFLVGHQICISKYDSILNALMDSLRKEKSHGTETIRETK